MKIIYDKVLTGGTKPHTQLNSVIKIMMSDTAELVKYIIETEKLSINEYTLKLCYIDKLIINVVPKNINSTTTSELYRLEMMLKAFLKKLSFTDVDASKNFDHNNSYKDITSLSVTASPTINAMYRLHEEYNSSNKECNILGDNNE